MSTTSTEDMLLTERQLAARWSFSPGSLANARSQGRSIPYVRIGSRVRYRLSDVLAAERAVIPAA
jgi:hypothetical protein